MFRMIATNPVNPGRIRMERAEHADSSVRRVAAAVCATSSERRVDVDRLRRVTAVNLRCRSTSRIVAATTDVITTRLGAAAAGRRQAEVSLQSTDRPLQLRPGTSPRALAIDVLSVDLPGSHAH